jgi:5-formyltetrahydrofolate cyclo-ligase
MTTSITSPPAKADLRAQVLAARDSLTPAQRNAQSQACIARLLGLPEWLTAGRVLAYYSFGSELDTSALLDASMQPPRRLALPRIQRGAEASLALHWVDTADALVAGMWGIKEPRSDAQGLALNEVDLVVVPGVAFDHHGHRLGYGKGFYDRLLSGRAKTVRVVALALDCQFVEAVPHTEHDQRIDLLVTPAGVWRFDS